MKFKVVPPARGCETLRAVRAAVPLVPDSVEDCCARVCQRTAVPGRDEAREWLTFCRALGLVDATDAGFRRVRETPDAAALATAFRETVYGADDVLAALEAADGPLSVDAVAAQIDIPAWERHHHQDPSTVWRDRVDRLLAWAVAFGLAESTADGYRA